LIGPNGAGKTTIFNVIHAAVQAGYGLGPVRREELAPHAAAPGRPSRDRAHVPDVELFRSMTVLDNVLVGAHTRTRPFPWRRRAGRAMEVLDYVGIADVAGRPAAGLPFGTLKRVELARALVAEPKLLLLDEHRRRPQPRRGVGARHLHFAGCATTST